MNDKTNSFNPFANFDFANFDVNKWMDANKMFADLRMPGFDVNAFMALQRKNIEALNAANQKAVESIQTIAKRQAEIMAQTMAEVSTSANQFASVASPQEMTAKQTDLVKQTFEKAMNNMRELAEIVSEANTETFAILNQRVTENIEELKALMPQQDSKKQDSKKS